MMRPPHKLLAGIWREADAVDRRAGRAARCRAGGRGADRPTRRRRSPKLRRLPGPSRHRTARRQSSNRWPGCAARTWRRRDVFIPRRDRVGTGDPTWGSARRQTPRRPALLAARAAPVTPPSRPPRDRRHQSGRDRDQSQAFHRVCARGLLGIGRGRAAGGTPADRRQPRFRRGAAGGRFHSQRAAAVGGDAARRARHAGSGFASPREICVGLTAAGNPGRSRPDDRPGPGRCRAWRRRPGASRLR